MNELKRGREKERKRKIDRNRHRLIGRNYFRVWERICVSKRNREWGRERKVKNKQEKMKTISWKEKYLKTKTVKRHFLRFLALPGSCGQNIMVYDRPWHISNVYIKFGENWLNAVEMHMYYIHRHKSFHFLVVMCCKIKTIILSQSINLAFQITNLNYLL